MGFLFGDSGAYKNAERNWENWEREAKAYYGNKAGEGINNTAYQRALAEEAKLLKNNLASTAATAAITGATPAAQAIAKQQATDAIAESTARMGANISQDQANAMGNYLNIAKAATEGKNSAMIAQAKAQSDAAMGLINAGTELATSLLKK